MWVEASAPSNIALIKYMGKTDPLLNQPCNTSISYTLEHLRTFVRIKENPQLNEDQWSLLQRKDLRSMTLSENGKNKFIRHLHFLKEQFHIKFFFEIESANNFPSDCGLASSASSFAALTLAFAKWVVDSKSSSDQDLLSVKKLALLSKKGSGSSCRSFFTPWAVWSHDDVKAVEIPIEKLRHQVILCDEKSKLVSSSQAHQRVLTSDLFKGRSDRAESRFLNLVSSLREKNWQDSFEICWNEMWDMHGLFHTSKPPFMYMNGDSQSVLAQLLDYWQKNDDGPLVTMDAGSNIHLLYRMNQNTIYDQLKSHFLKDYAVWSDEGYHDKI